MGIGGNTIEQALATLSDMTAGAVPIGREEHVARIAKAQAFMQAQGISALWLNAGTSLLYFTGMKWHASERMVGAILPAEGELAYLAPAFEEATLRDFMVVDGPIHTWHEHENPCALFVDTLEALGIEPGARIGGEAERSQVPFPCARRARARETACSAEPCSASRSSPSTAPSTMPST